MLLLLSIFHEIDLHLQQPCVSRCIYNANPFSLGESPQSTSPKGVGRIVKSEARFPIKKIRVTPHLAFPRDSFVSTEPTDTAADIPFCASPVYYIR